MKRKNRILVGVVLAAAFLCGLVFGSQGFPNRVQVVLEENYGFRSKEEWEISRPVSTGHPIFLYNKRTGKTFRYTVQGDRWGFFEAPK